jgi:FixJ family two-component response regulator
MHQVVFVLDDEASVVTGIERLLRATGLSVRPFTSPSLFLETIRPTEPGCVILDLSLPEMDGLEIQKRLVASGNLHPIVFLTGHGNVHASVAAMKAGAVDFIEKPFEAQELLDTVRHALAQDVLRRARVNEAARIAERFSGLTARESEVMRHVIAGRLNKQIAAALGTAEKTVKVHRARVMRKTSARSVAELTRLAIASGIRPMQ